AFEAQLARLQTTPEGEDLTEAAPAPAVNDERRSRIDKSVLALPEPRRLRDKQHLRFVAKQPCLVCGRQPSDPHHLRFAQNRGLALKVSDEFTIPLCRAHHRELHRAGTELIWWSKIGIEPLAFAQELWSPTHRIALGNDATSEPSQTIAGSALEADAPRLQLPTAIPRRDVGQR